MDNGAINFGNITEYLDTTQVLLYAFWAFFFYLIFYLVQEGKREGYPLTTDSLDPGSRQVLTGDTFFPEPKTFVLADGSSVMAPDAQTADKRKLNAQALANTTGYPIEPTGDPMVAGVGPGSSAERKNIPDMTVGGAPKIIPMRVAEGFGVDENDPDPRGMSVVGADGVAAGTVADLWIDTPEHLIRYLEVDVGGGKRALFPFALAVVDGDSREIKVQSLMSHHFANAPGLSDPNQVTRLEEEKIYGYFGAGTLYASPDRAEPFL